MIRVHVRLAGLVTAAVIAAAQVATFAQDRASSTQPVRPGPLEQRAVPVTPENPIPRRIASALPEYPAEETANARGTVTLRITLDDSGRVAETRQPFVPDYSITTRVNNSFAISPALGPAFRRSAVAAVEQWRYDPPARAPISFYVRLSFAPGTESELVWHDARPPASAPPGAGAGVVVGFGSEPPAVPLPPPSEPVRVGGKVLPPQKIKDVPPVYPSIAQSARIQGIVIVEVLVGADGRVSSAKVIRSIPLLDQAALDAVRQWEFSPPLLNGQPTPVLMSVTVVFKLTDPPPQR
jgi:TonB family protein